GTGDLGGAAGDAHLAGDRGVDLRRGDDLVVEDDGDAALGVALRVARGLPGQVGPVLVVLEVHGDEPARGVLLVEARLGVLDVLTGHLRGREPQTLTVLVGQDALALVVRLRLDLAGLRAEHRVHGQLGRLAQDVGRLARVLQTRQLDDDPVLAGADDGRFGDAERVDPAAQDLERAVGRRGVGLRGLGRAGLQ